MAVLAGSIVALIDLTVVAMVVYDPKRTRRSDEFEDEHMETLTEYRIRRNSIRADRSTGGIQ